LEIPKTVSKIPNSTLEIPKSDFENSKVPSILSEPAQLTSPINQPNNQGGVRARAPAPAPDTGEYVPIIERLTGTRSSAGWRIEGEIKQQAIALREMEFSPADVTAVAGNSTRSNYRLRFLAEDLAAERERQKNGRGNDAVKRTGERTGEQVSGESRVSSFKARKRI
jgi:hypothetical protein